MTVTVKLSHAKGAVVAAARRDIELTRSHPNGNSCDGEGYVGGVLKMTAGACTRGQRTASGLRATAMRRCLDEPVPNFLEEFAFAVIAFSGSHDPLLGDPARRPARDT